MKTAIVLGTMNSGSGIVHDYLSSRADFLSPFGNSEFKLCVDPMGLHNLYNSCYKNFSFFNPANAINDFLDYLEKYQNYIVYPTYGNGQRLFKKKIIKLSREFINNITEVLYYGNPEFSNFKINKFQNIYLKVKKERYKFYPVRMPVNEKKFVKESRLFIKKIILNNLNKKTIHKNQNIVLNQASNIFDPINSSQYFYNRKVIIVTRDPRDIFSSMKTRKSKGSPSYDVYLFLKWFKKCFDNSTFKKALNNKDVLIVKFENFLNNFDIENKKICKFLKINEKFKFKNTSEILFNLEKSKNNMYKSKKNLTFNENKILKKNLRKFLQW